MMTVRRKTEEDTERAYDRRSGTSLGPLFRRLSFSEVLSVLAILGLLLTALGYRRFSIEEEAKMRAAADSSMERDIRSNRKSIDSLGNQAWFTNYLLCTSMDARKRPDACTDILRQGPTR